MKFKVGDKVRVRKDLVLNHTYGNYFFVSTMEKFKDKIVTIISVCNNCYEIKEDNKCSYWTDEMLEPNVVNFTKADLKDGMVVEYQNGEKRMVLGDRLISNHHFAELSNFTDILKNKYLDNMAINRVYSSSGYTFSDYFEDRLLTLIWERPKEEPIKEMTVAEIEKELGYKVKIKSED
jgi:hypothetical protein